MGKSARLAAAIATMVTFSAPQASAADTQGGYALRGAGTLTCTNYLAIVADPKRDRSDLVAWMDGYVTAHNRHQQDTFDALPVLSPAALLSFVRNVCAAKQDLLVENALAQVLRVLASHRLERHSPVVTARVGDNSVTLRQETLVRAQTKLREKGFYKSAPDGVFGAGTRAAFQAFQKQAGIRETGLPDPNTLVRLLFDNG